MDQEQGGRKTERGIRLPLDKPFARNETLVSAGVVRTSSLTSKAMLPMWAGQPMQLQAGLQSSLSQSVSASPPQISARETEPSERRSTNGIMLSLCEARIRRRTGRIEIQDRQDPVRIRLSVDALDCRFFTASLLYCLGGINDGLLRPCISSIELDLDKLVPGI